MRRLAPSLPTCRATKKRIGRLVRAIHVEMQWEVFARRSARSASRIPSPCASHTRLQVRTSGTTNINIHVSFGNSTAGRQDLSRSRQASSAEVGLACEERYTACNQPASWISKAEMWTCELPARRDAASASEERFLSCLVLLSFMIIAFTACNMIDTAPAIIHGL